MTCLFYLGTHIPGWLGLYDVPLFVSRRTLAKRKRLPRARGRWSLDSGGFTELQLHGRWTVGPAAYAAEVRRFRDEVGGLDWAAPQDWMCERQVVSGLVVRRNPKAKRPPAINLHQWLAWARTAGPVLADAVVTAEALGAEAVVKFHGTGLSIAEHQRRTVENFVELRGIAPDLPWIPVLQGWSLADYLRCALLYRQRGVDLRNFHTVGLGTVCRREHTNEAERIISALAALGLKLHGFGFKKRGVENTGHLLVSADSLAWSFCARRAPPLSECIAAGKRHKNCANCDRYAMRWREELLARIGAQPVVNGEAA